VIIEPTASEPVLTEHAPRWRIGAVAAVVVLAIGIGTVLGVALGGRRGAGLGAAAGYVPADAVIYLEARFDLPGAQRENLRALIERFPGADADAILGDALADTLDEAMTGAPFTYSADVAPWFDGRASLALLSLPFPTADAAVASPDAVFLFGVRDAAAASDFVDRLRAELEADGATLSSSEAHGVTIWSLDSTAGAPMGGELAYAVTEDQLVLAPTTAVVQAALDTHAGDTASLAGREDVGSLGAHLPAEVAGLMTVDTESLLSSMRAAMPVEMQAVLDQSIADAPALMMAAVSFEGDAVVLDTAIDLPSGSNAGNASRNLADEVPADVMLYSDAGNIGEQLVASIAAMREMVAAVPGGDPAGLDDVEAALGGSFDDLVSWIGDGVMVAGYDGEQPYAGAILRATDADAAATTMNRLRSLVSLAALDPSSGIAVSTETVAGAEVTTIRVAGGDADLATMGISEFVVQWAVDGDRVVIGFGDRFVGRVLELDAADSLGATARFGAASGRVGGDSASLVFVDLAALRDAVVTYMPVDVRVGYDRDAAPWLEPLDYLVGASSVDGDTVTEHVELVLQ